MAKKEINNRASAIINTEIKRQIGDAKKELAADVAEGKKNAKAAVVSDVQEAGKNMKSEISQAAAAAVNQVSKEISTHATTALEANVEQVAKKEINNQAPAMINTEIKRQLGNTKAKWINEVNEEMKNATANAVSEVKESGKNIESEITQATAAAVEQISTEINSLAATALYTSAPTVTRAVLESKELSEKVRSHTAKMRREVEAEARTQLEQVANEHQYQLANKNLIAKLNTEWATTIKTLQEDWHAKTKAMKAENGRAAQQFHSDLMKIKAESEAHAKANAVQLAASEARQAEVISLRADVTRLVWVLGSSILALATIAVMNRL